MDVYGPLEARKFFLIYVTKKGDISSFLLYKYINNWPMGLELYKFLSSMTSVVWLSNIHSHTTSFWCTGVWTYGRLEARKSLGYVNSNWFGNILWRHRSHDYIRPQKPRTDLIQWLNVEGAKSRRTLIITTISHQWWDNRKLINHRLEINGVLHYLEKT